MITDLILDFLHSLAVNVFTWARQNLPSPPDFVADITSGFDTVLGVIPQGIRYFVPLGPVVGLGLALVAVLVAVGLIRLARRVLSLFTGGGGNA
jgi:hypothetical protein